MGVCSNRDQATSGESNLSLSPTTRLTTTESAVFKDWLLYLSDYLDITKAGVMLCSGIEVFPALRYSVVTFTLSCPLGLYGSTPLFGNRLRSANYFHKQTRSNRVCCFQTFDVVFSHFAEYLDITTAGVSSCGSPKHFSHASI